MYNNYYQQPYQQQDERIWVQNEASAEAYLVAPNGFVRLWSASEPVFYEKRADVTGRPLPLEAYEYKRREAKQLQFVPQPTIDYLKEIDGIKERLNALEGGAAHGTESNANAASV